MIPTILCIANSRAHAEQIVDRLQSASVPVADISALVFTTDAAGRPDPIKGLHHAGVDAQTEKVAAGAATGGVAGAAAGVATMSIVGLTPFLMLAPLVVATTAAVGSAAGAGAGAAFAGLSDYGIPPASRAQYEQALSNGGWLIAVRTEDESELARAQSVFEQSGGQNIDLFRLTKKLS